jgi:hypothetical protein
MERTSPGIGQAFNDGLEGFKRNPVTAIVGVLIFLIIVAVGSVIPFINFLFIPFVIPPLVGGYILFYLKFAKGEEPSIEGLFSGFQKYLTYLGAYWLFALYITLFGIPGIILIIIGIFVKGCFGGFLMAIGYLAWLVLAVIFAIKWAFNLFIIADDWNEGRILPAFDKSMKITDGRILEVFLVLLVLGIFGAAGTIVFGVGALVTYPIALIGMASYYLAIKKEYLEKSGPAEDIMEPLAPETTPEPPPGG